MCIGLTADWKKYLDGNPTVFLATSEENHPHVRPLTLIHQDEAIWFATCRNDHKLMELEHNKACEVCLVVNDPFDPQGSIRLHGEAHIVMDDTIRRQIGPSIPFFPLLWESFTDPDYCLIRFDAHSGTYHDATHNAYYDLKL